MLAPLDERHSVFPEALAFPVGSQTPVKGSRRRKLWEIPHKFHCPVIGVCYHDGGLEESLHRIDSALAAADIVICQAGCISHNAYWRVKELCKRTGKPCMFVKNSGVSSFGRVVSELGKMPL
jgi:hypothetical protein